MHIYIYCIPVRTPHLSPVYLFRYENAYCTLDSRRSIWDISLSFALRLHLHTHTDIFYPFFNMQLCGMRLCVCVCVGKTDRKKGYMDGYKI